MTIFVLTRDAALEEQMHRALERAGWPSASLPAGGWNERWPRPSALVLDADCALPPGLGVAVPTISLVPDGVPDALAQSAQRGARVILRKPFTQRALEHAVRSALPARSPRALRPIAVDPVMRGVCAQLEALAGMELTVVLSGEAGTGKTHLARWLHSLSPRAFGPLVELPSAALSSGAAAECLDGAGADEPGALERAHGGSLLIEDVAELRSSEQLALLRFLVDRTDGRGAPIDARVIATSRGGLAHDVREGRLHPDLAARLAAAELALPPLRARALDVAPFARNFAERAAHAADVQPPVIGEADCEALRGLPLAGNLHELESLMQRAALLAPGRPLDVAALLLRRGPAPELAPESRGSAETLDLRALEQRTIERALALSRGDRNLAARALGIHVRTLRNKLREVAR
jgi:two-component system response regulator FlrC